MRGSGRTAVLALGLALAGCSADDGGDAAEDAGQDATGASVSIVDFAFEPATVTVDEGGAVAWTNDGDVGHTVTAGTPGDPSDVFDLSVEPGSSIEITLDEPGTVSYFCSIHPAMTGVVEVS